MSGPFKATSVTEAGEPDDFAPPLLYSPQVGPDGTTRLVVSAPGSDLPRIHRLLVESLKAPLGVLWVQLVDRASGQRQEDDPRRWLTLEQQADAVLSVMDRSRHLLYGDARGQLWIRGALGEQLVLDELGMVYLYPDDPAFRATLETAGVGQSSAPTLADRDYVRVEFDAAADSEEQALLKDLSMQPLALNEVSPDA
jgi:hypothetical protein